MQKHYSSLADIPQEHLQEGDRLTVVVAAEKRLEVTYLRGGNKDSDERNGTTRVTPRLERKKHDTVSDQKKAHRTKKSESNANKEFPPRLTWSRATLQAVLQQIYENYVTKVSFYFTYKELCTYQLAWIVLVTRSKGKTPDKTLSRELQDLRDNGIIRFVDDRGTYSLRKKYQKWFSGVDK